MHGRSLKLPMVAAVALALLASAPASGQALNQRLDAAEQQLDADTNACRPINIADYATLLNEASLNKKRAAKAAKSGLPIDEAQLDADLAKATVLFHRAQVALVQQCVRQATQPQAQPKATSGTAAATPATPPPQKAADQQPVGTALKIAQAEERFRAELRGCKRISIEHYKELHREAERNLHRAFEAAKAGFPVKIEQVVTDLERATRLLEEAEAAEAYQRPCPPTQSQSQRSTPSMPSPRDEVGSTPPASLAPADQRILNLHNQERVAVGVPPLRWDPALAQTAIAYAAEMARTGRLSHASREGRGIVRENINQAFHGSSPDQLMANWLSEKRHFVPGTFPNVSRTGNWADVGHYSQMIWPATTRVGCGSARGARWDYFVCRYSPGGNKDGQPVGMRAGQPQ